MRRHSGHYDPIAKSLHWLTALAIVVMLALGIIMTDENLISSEIASILVLWHKSLGLTLLVVFLFRVYWRLNNSPPPLPVNIPNWQRLAAKLMHMALYGLLIIMPLTGWLITSTSRYPTMLFGIMPLPNLPFLADLPDRAGVHKLFEEIHEMLAHLIIVLVALHIGAALKHHFINRDHVLMRMSPVIMGPFLRKIRGG